MTQLFGDLSASRTADQVVSGIKKAAEAKRMLPRTKYDILEALYSGEGYPIIRKYEVIAYGEMTEKKRMFLLRSIVVSENYQGQKLGEQVTSNRIEYAHAINPDKPITVICPTDVVGFYRKIGFIKQAKDNLPVGLYGQRTMEEWMKSDRVWMTIPNKAYWDKFKAAKGHEG